MHPIPFAYPGLSPRSALLNHNLSPTTLLPNRSPHSHESPVLSVRPCLISRITPELTRCESFGVFDAVGTCRFQWGRGVRGRVGDVDGTIEIVREV